MKAIHNLRSKMGPLKFSLVAGGVILLGSVATAAAANPSKPGDPLYSIDRGVEKIQLAVSLSGEMKESTHKALAKERIVEMEKLFDDDSLDIAGIADALNNFEDHKRQVADLVENEDEAKEADDEFEAHESQIDKLFETQQAAIENEREALKKKYEAAIKANNFDEARKLKLQIDALEPTLKELEAKREAAKKKLEASEETIEKHISEAAKKQEEAEREAAKKQEEATKKQQEEAAEAQKKALEKQAEEAKKLQEQQEEAAKKAAEEAKEASED